MILSSISYSSYRDFQVCPRLFFYRRILHLKFNENPLPLVLGHAFHSALELMEKDGKNPVQVFDAEFTKDKVPQVSVEKFAIEREQAERLLSLWLETKEQRMKEENFKIVEQEVSFELHVDQDPLTSNKLSIPPIKGVVDFITENGGIGDYKTSSKKYTQKMIDISDQPTFYYLWHLLERGSLPKEFIYIVFRKKIKKEPIQILRTTRTLTQISKLLAEIQKMVLKVENKEYYGKHDSSVYFCDCNKYEEMLNI